MDKLNKLTPIKNSVSNTVPKIKDFVTLKRSKFVVCLKAKFSKIVIASCVIILILFGLFSYFIYAVSPKEKLDNGTTYTLYSGPHHYGEEGSMDDFYYTTASTANVTSYTTPTKNLYQMDVYLELLKNRVKNDTAIPAFIKHDLIKHILNEMKTMINNHTVKERSVEMIPAANMSRENSASNITGLETTIEKYVNISMLEIEKGLKYLDYTLNNVKSLFSNLSTANFTVKRLFSNLSTIKFTSLPIYQTTISSNQHKQLALVDEWLYYDGR